MEAAREWKGREGGGNGGSAVGAVAVHGVAAGVVGDGWPRWRRTGAGATLRGLATRAAGLAAVVISGSAAPT